MWKREDAPSDLQTADPIKAQEWPAPSAPAPVAAAVTTPQGAERATIGRSIVVRGDVSGDEDLLIQGRVEGSVNLRQHSVTIGPDGEVNASIAGRLVTVEGRVEGNIDGAEQVILRSSAYVKGDIKAPRLVLENGARFRGLVDMGEEEERGTPAEGAARFDATKVFPKGRNGGDPANAPAIDGGRPGGETSENGIAAGEAKPLGQSGGGSGKGRRGNEAETQIAL